MNTGKKIKLIRTFRGLTQKELGEAWEYMKLQSVSMSLERIFLSLNSLEKCRCTWCQC